MASGELQPMMATAFAQQFWFDLLFQYNAAPVEERAGFVAKYCADAAHSVWCAGIQSL